ncbi:hypothetical protein CC86DRAFT_144443 [Ophiobolus disseminans]|uniref:Uncharacterized protein n=1 Tax=Ophiobolus disseminans TaxID=1469910 RepID=A0A6A6ZF26_9PLEO|nr:hypothetical protein CC86DRAFT_144443 [Ophiobolus disseminans]
MLLNCPKRLRRALLQRSRHCESKKYCRTRYAKRAHKLISVQELKLKHIKHNLSRLEDLGPLQDQQRFSRVLSVILNKSPFPRLNRLTMTFHILHHELGWELNALGSVYQLRDPIQPLAQFQAICYHTNTRFRATRGAREATWLRVDELIEYPTRSLIMSKAALKSFQARSRNLEVLITAAERDYITMIFRRYHGEDKHVISYSLHHQIQHMNIERKSFDTQIRHWFKSILVADTQNRVRRKEKQFWNTLETLAEVYNIITCIHYDDLVPILAQHIDIMSPAETQRRMEIARQYWITHWHRQQKHDSNLAQIERTENGLSQHKKQVPSIGKKAEQEISCRPARRPSQ